MALVAPVWAQGRLRVAWVQDSRSLRVSYSEEMNCLHKSCFAAADDKIEYGDVLVSTGVWKLDQRAAVCPVCVIKGHVKYKR